MEAVGDEETERGSEGSRKKEGKGETVKDMGWGGGGVVFVFGNKKGSVMSRIMSTGHPSATCRLKMRDLVSSLSRWGFHD